MNGRIRYSRGLQARIWAYQARELALQLLDRVLAFTGVRFCASKLNYVAALEKARMDAITTTIGNAGKLWIYKGTQPAGPGTTHALTLVAGPFTLGSPFAPGATTALPSVLSPTLPSNVNATTSDQPTWWRVSTSGGSDGAAGSIDGSAGTSGCDMTVGPTTSGQPVAITAWTHSSATYGH
jgi:hypothetical protein